MERRDALKLLTVMATAALSSPALPAHGQEQNAPVDLNRKPTAPAGEVLQVNSPERLLAAEPEIAINPEGEATVSFKTVVPTQGATIYVGIPNDEVRLEFPIYSASTPVAEDSPTTDHNAVVDVRVYVTRFAAKMALTGGTLAYRIEVLDPRKPAIQFIDRRLRFLVNNDRYAKGLTVIEGPNLAMVSDSTATVWWLTDAESDGSVEVEGKKFQSKAAGTRHVVTIDGLDAGKRHEYRIESRVNDDHFSTRMYAFRTAPKEPEFSFVFTCDGRTGGLGGGETALEGINGESARALSIQMLSHDPDFLIFTGDLISGYTSSVEDYRAQLRSWKRIYGPLWRWVPIYTGMGNHESLVDVYDLRSQFDKRGPEYYHYYSEMEYEYNNIKQGNRNPLLYKGVGADGLKTGHTEEAGYSLTASVKREDRRIILMLGGLPTMKTRAQESERLIEWAFREFNDYKLFAAGDKVEEADVWLGSDPKVPLTVANDLAVTLPRKSRKDMKVTVDYDRPIPAPVKKGQAMGTSWW